MMRPRSQPSLSCLAARGAKLWPMHYLEKAPLTAQALRILPRFQKVTLYSFCDTPMALGGSWNEPIKSQKRANTLTLTLHSMPLRPKPSLRRRRRQPGSATKPHFVYRPDAAYRASEADAVQRCTLHGAAQLERFGSEAS
jgi:hypothetical protein